MSRTFKRRAWAIFRWRAFAYSAWCSFYCLRTTIFLNSIKDWASAPKSIPPLVRYERFCSLFRLGEGNSVWTHETDRTWSTKGFSSKDIKVLLFSHFMILRRFASSMELRRGSVGFWKQSSMKQGQQYSSNTFALLGLSMALELFAISWHWRTFLWHRIERRLVTLDAQIAGTWPCTDVSRRAPHYGLFSNKIQTASCLLRHCESTLNLNC